jgi:hypothetical protein
MGEEELLQGATWDVYSFITTFDTNTLEGRAMQSR